MCVCVCVYDASDGFQQQKSDSFDTSGQTGLDTGKHYAYGILVTSARGHLISIVP